jgi:hypothetical protein
VIRKPIAAIACIVAPILLVAAGVIIWANRTVLDGGHVAQEVDAALAEPEVSDALIDAIVVRLPQDPAVQAAARPTLEQVVATPVFRNTVSNAVLAAHATLVDGDEPDVILDLTEYVDELQAEVAKVDPAAAQLIPPATPIQVYLAERTELPWVWRTTAAMRRIAPALLVLGVSLGALGLVVAERRGRWLGIAGLIAGLLAIGLWFLTSIATDTAVDSISDPALREPAHTIVDRLTSGLSTQMLAIAGVAAAAIVIALIVARFEPEPF